MKRMTVLLTAIALALAAPAASATAGCPPVDVASSEVHQVQQTLAKAKTKAQRALASRPAVR